MLLKNKVAVVTGASGGIGFQIAKEYAARGATVIVCSRKIASAEKTANMIKGKAYPERLDVTDAPGVTKFVRHVAERHGRIDILINNAGYPFDRNMWTKRFHEVAEEEFDRVIEVDLKGTLRLCLSALPFMIKGGGGVIINISSTPAVSGHTEGAPYTVAKAGVIAITKHIALEYGDKNVRAYTLALGNISSEATFNSMTVTERKKAAMENSMKRWGDPSEVAKVAASLASDDFSFATGNTIVIDGGTVLL
ncbi:SDR family NAD(P)-dependent oxidoreductase [Candidatus Nitrososphaera gargensis]|uniref:SDR family NAD(P)-dependent oxidoreductase n=1 Tax=Candidatus Nitrososphaera gargensis TaxID=497727 RepID=UPI001650A3CE|nr:SDR family NAD(P)-dependent oxidoreductase [Candidatus Nitrososphaera gargensis]